MKKILYISLGALTFALGTIGIFVPFLPTTVFYLLTGFFWLRSSEKLYTKFIQSESYRKYVDEPLVKKKMTTKSMVKMFSVIFIIFLIPCLLVDNTIMRVTMAIVYLAHVIFLTWYLKGKKATTAQGMVEVGKSND